MKEGNKMRRPPKENRLHSLEHLVANMMEEIKVHRRQIEVLTELARRDIEEEANKSTKEEAMK